MTATRTTDQATPARTRHDGNAHHYDYSSESPHFIEQALNVYLRLADDGTRWIVDSVNVDGHQPATQSGRLVSQPRPAAHR